MQGGSSTYTPLDTSTSTVASDSSYAAKSRPSTGDCPVFPTLCNPVFVLEKHMSVIRKGPTMPPTLEMQSVKEETAAVSGDPARGKVSAKFSGERMWGSWNFCNFPQPCNVSYSPNTRGTAFDAEDISLFYHPDKTHKKQGDRLVIPIDISQTGEDWSVNDKLRIEHEYTDSLGFVKIAVATVSIDGVDYIGKPSSGSTLTGYSQLPQLVAQGLAPGDCNGIWGTYSGNTDRYVYTTIITITGTFPKYPVKDDFGMPTGEDIYNVNLIQDPPMFQKKFPRFAYRYKYEDGEYSVYSPFSEIAFIPETFDYLPKKGYNLGMENALRTLRIKDFIPKDIPEDVIQVDILYKESNSPNVYTVTSVKRDDLPQDGLSTKPWETPGTGDNFGNYKVKSELIHQVVPSNQLLRPWDNVPKRARAQEITANRLIYANYVQNYNVKDKFNDTVVPKFSTMVEQIDHSLNTTAAAGPKLGEPAKSLKSMRTYQLGIVYRGRYGRETPVLTDKTGSFKIDKDYAVTQNRLQVQMNSNPPYWAESYTFYIKETSNEYYNLAMDRWYDAEDGGIWLSFPSAERNKISGRLGDESTTTLILKKQHDSHVFTGEKIRYKVLAVQDNAPTFIKTDLKYWGSLPMCLPPPGWGDIGNWDSGMFYPSGLPLPNRMFIDIIAEYWDQSVMRSLSGRDGAQIRVIQSAGQASAYNSGMTDSTNKSNWYNVANIEYIGAPPQTFEEAIEDPDTGVVTTTEVEESGGPVQLVRVSLEKAFGEDVGFAKPEYNDYFNQPSNSILDKGISIEARTKDVKDKAQFEGRFFVKVLRDFNIEQNIVNPQQEFSEKYQVLESKDLRYIAAAHPGLQDWNNSSTYFVSIGQEDISSFGLAGSKLAEVSSLSEIHANKGCHYLDISGAAQVTPAAGGPGNRWPMGPGDQTDGTYGPNVSSFYWGTKYADFLDSSNEWPDEQPVSTQYDWPSYGVGSWNPYMCYNDCDGSGQPAAGQMYAHNIIGNTTPHPYHSGTTPSTLGSRKRDVSKNGIVHLHEAISFFATLPLNNYDPGSTFGNDHSYLDGANPYNLPAIWGDQSDLLTTPPVWKSGTAEKLREDWYYLWRGRDVNKDERWPLGRFHPNRWIIDKAGAAKGYSGNGVWDDGNVGYMDVSYWGIGKETEYNRKQNHAELFGLNHPTEVSFANAISTVGTQFRFKQDPDQVVYTITNVEVNDNVWNYEVFHGGYGTTNDDGKTWNGGSQLGRKHPPVWGGEDADSPLYGGKAFISDLFSKSKKLTGGAPYNKRIRFTLTLDKIVGREGGSGFHPITNHVDAAGVSNIKSGRGYYATDCSSGHVTTAKGGTPPNHEFFNLNSYWNAADNAGGGFSSQPDDISDTFYTNNPDAYIGLHERGLNETTIEIVTPYRGDEGESERMSTNPAVWETEPSEDVGLDIYYAASPTYPVKIQRFRQETDKLFDASGYPDYYGANWYDYGLRGEEIIPVGSDFEPLNNSISTVPAAAKICAVQNNTIWLKPIAGSGVDSAFQDVNGNDINIDLGCQIKISHQGEGTYYGAAYDREEIYLEVTKQLAKNAYQVEINTHAAKRQLGYFNCYSFGNGVESNRIRDDFNAVQIDKGVKASAPLAEQYKEERKGSGLIFSGIYNSTSGINRTNQFIQAEPITKDLNPVNGSIQKLHTRDTDLLTFCENKVFKILAKKDALFNADGNTNVTSNQAVLGQTIPFTGEYGISKNPESFASESYRVYFADKARGAVLRLSRDGLTPISEAGMRDWFKDNLRFASSIIGSYDDREDQYNITVETRDQDGNDKAYTLSWVESKKGWVSFKSFIQQGGISHKNIYYTFPSNKYNYRNYEDPWGVNYYSPGQGRAETWQHHLDLIIKRDVQISSSSANNIIVVSNGLGTLVPGMNVEGNGIYIDTIINEVTCTGQTCTVKLNKAAWVENGNVITFTTARNSFYGNNEHYSSVKVLFNKAQGIVKRFKTLDYEGTQAKIIRRDNNNHILEGQNLGQIYYDNVAKKGWYVENMFTDMQEGRVPEFLDKENKWYNFIRGYEDAGKHDEIDTSEFSLQGLGRADVGEEPPPPPPPPPPPNFTFDCIDGNCKVNPTGNGQYNDLATCQANCGQVQPSFDCVDGDCIDPGTGMGQYTTLTDCEDQCGNIPQTWDCVDAGTSNALCVERYDGSGQFTNLGDCWNNCSNQVISFNCVLYPANTAPDYYTVDTYLCEDPGDGSGTYTSMSACQNACVAPEDTYDCIAGQGCTINTNGTGFYTGPTALQDCTDDCNHYCDLSAGGLGCNQQGVGTHVGSSCDPATCRPTSNSETYHLFCHWDQAGNYGTLYYIDQTTFDNQCLPVIGHASGPQFSIDPQSAFYVDSTGACSRYIGALTNMPTPVAGDYITQPGPYNNPVTYYYEPTGNNTGCLLHPHYSNQNYYFAPTQTMPSSCQQCDPLFDPPSGDGGFTDGPEALVQPPPSTDGRSIDPVKDKGNYKGDTVVEVKNKHQVTAEIKPITLAEGSITRETVRRDTSSLRSFSEDINSDNLRTY